MSLRFNFFNLPHHTKFTYCIQLCFCSFLFICSAQTYGQSQNEELFYPFDIKRVHVPHASRWCGTGVPQRVKTKSAKQAIFNAFDAMGIELEENVSLDIDSSTMFLTGYNAEEKIGFVFIDRSNMDATLYRPHTKHGALPVRNIIKEKTHTNWWDKNVLVYKKETQKYFDIFLKNKKSGLAIFKKYSRLASNKQIYQKLQALEAIETNRTQFEGLLLQLRLNEQRTKAFEKEPLQKEMVDQFEKRFEDTILKLVLYDKVASFKGSLAKDEPYFQKLLTKIDKLKLEENDYRFLENFNHLRLFHIYDLPNFEKDEKYFSIKMDIMDEHPVSSWMDELSPLQQYYKDRTVSLKEARDLDAKNKNGEQFIAPIFYHDPLMIIQYPIIPSLPSSHPLFKEQTEILNELKEVFRTEKEALDRKRLDINVVYENHGHATMHHLPKNIQDSISVLIHKELQLVDLKYEDEDAAIEEERVRVDKKFAEWIEREKLWKAESRRNAETQTLDRLEEKVKMYIKWARSQMKG